MSHVLRDRQDEQLALIREEPGGAGRSLAIFVHGFRGDHLTTWGKLPGLLEQHAGTEPVLQPWDFLFLGYPTRKITTYLDIARLIMTQWVSAAAGKPPFTGPYTRLALIGHSLGTLGIRQLLCAGMLHPPGMLKALHSVTLFGTPLNGSDLANWGGNIAGGQIADALKPGNPQLRMLRAWNDTVQPQYQWRKVSLVLGTDDQVVGHEYAELITFAGDDPALLLNFDHGDLVKPKDWKNSSIRDQIVGALQ